MLKTRKRSGDRAVAILQHCEKTIGCYQRPEGVLLGDVASKIIALDAILCNLKNDELLDNEAEEFLRAFTTESVIEFMAVNGLSDADALFLKEWLRDGLNEWDWLTTERAIRLTAVFMKHVKPFAKNFVEKILIPLSDLCGEKPETIVLNKE